MTNYEMITDVVQADEHGVKCLFRMVPSVPSLKSRVNLFGLVEISFGRSTVVINFVDMIVREVDSGNWAESTSGGLSECVERA